jgi:hypothetical protein
VTLYLLMVPQYYSPEVVGIFGTMDAVRAAGAARWPGSSWVEKGQYGEQAWSFTDGYGDSLGFVQMLRLSEELAARLVTRGLGTVA